ncbi:hypothetical protein HK096_003269 [Nowakowskiella sp. JEL0078]|nr:hypothetical protein HK096_003269 [Nowakowskiella sp. JEL0078]
MIPTLCNILQLHIDPDEIEKETGHRWTLIEKDMRRRAWWSAIFFMENDKFKSPGNVKLPLPNRVFMSLPTNLYTLTGAYLPSNCDVPSNIELDSCAQELAILSQVAMDFHVKTLAVSDRIRLFEEALKLFMQIVKWFENVPGWMNLVMSPSSTFSTYSTSNPVTIAFWNANVAFALSNTLILLTFRFSVIDFCKCQENPNAKWWVGQFSDTVPYRHSRDAATKILTFLSDVLCRLDPDFKNVNMLTIVILDNLARFLAVQSRFGESDIIRDSSSNDFNFVASVMTKLSMKRWKICIRLLERLEALRNRASIEQCVNTLEQLMAGPGPFAPFEEHQVASKPIDEALLNSSSLPNFGLQEFQHSSMGIPTSSLFQENPNGSMMNIAFTTGISNGSILTTSTAPHMIFYPPSEDFSQFPV